MCSRPAARRDASGSACADEPVATATTNAEGQVEFADVAIGNYLIAVEIDGRWALGRPRGMTMRAGMTGNLGKVSIPETAP